MVGWPEVYLTLPRCGLPVLLADIRVFLCCCDGLALADVPQQSFKHARKS